MMVQPTISRSTRLSSSLLAKSIDERDARRCLRVRARARSAPAMRTLSSRSQSGCACLHAGVDHAAHALHLAALDREHDRGRAVVAAHELHPGAEHRVERESGSRGSRCRTRRSSSPCLNRSSRVCERASCARRSRRRDLVVGAAEPGEVLAVELGRAARRTPARARRCRRSARARSRPSARRCRDDWRPARCRRPACS